MSCSKSCPALKPLFHAVLRRFGRMLAFIEDCAAGRERCCMNYYHGRPLLQSAPLSRLYYANELAPPPITRLLALFSCMYYYPEREPRVCGAAARRFSLCVLCPGCERCGRPESRPSVLSSIMRYFSTFLSLDFQFLQPKNRLWGV